MNVETSLWKHVKSGEQYRLLWIANTHAEESRKHEYPETAVYQRVADKTIWARPLESWTKNFVHEGLL